MDILYSRSLILSLRLTTKTYEIIETYKQSRKNPDSSFHDLTLQHLSSLQLSEIRKGNVNQTVIGKKVVDNKEELEAGAEDDDVDNVGDSEGDEFEQETGWRTPPCVFVSLSFFFSVYLSTSIGTSIVIFICNIKKQCLAKDV